jgi:hypothetical protein
MTAETASFPDGLTLTREPSSLIVNLPDGWITERITIRDPAGVILADALWTHPEVNRD